MFGFGRRGAKRRAEEAPRIAAERTNTPLDNRMTLLLAEELPLLDSAERVRVYEILNSYEGPQICSQEELPEEIRRLMDL